MARLKPSKKGDVRQVTVATQKPTKAGQKKSTKKNGPSASSSLTIAPPPSITSTTTTPSKTDENLQKPHRLDVDQVDRAVRALRTHHAKVITERVANSKKRLDLLGDDVDFLYAQIGLEHIPDRPTPKPIPIPLPHPFYSTDEGFDMCLFVKEDCKSVVKKALEALKLPGVSTVVGLQELRVDYRKYEERRKLRDAFDLFLVDDRILPNLGRALGKVFFSKKKQPVPIKIGGLAGKGDPAVVAKRVDAARRHTYMYLSHGTCVSIRVGKTNQSPQALRENIVMAVQGAVEKIPHKWKNVVSICLKTSESVALPVYNKLPNSVLLALTGEGKETEEKEEEEEDKAQPSALVGKKRKESPVVAKTESLLVKSHLEDKAKKARLEEKKMKKKEEKQQRLVTSPPTSASAGVKPQKPSGGKGEGLANGVKKEQKKVGIAPAAVIGKKKKGKGKGL